MSNYMPNPLAEVFGFPTSNKSSEAKRYRRLRLCPFNNKVPSCTKDKAQNPLGVCTIRDGDELAITCPIRFREDWTIAENAADFFFPKRTNWTSLTEIRLNDKQGKSAGNIDLVLVSYDSNGKITDFGSLEIQGVYISGNVRKPFEKFMGNHDKSKNFDWSDQPNYPHADYLSSSRKRLVPQLIYKGGILHNWKKRMAVALHEGFYKTLPELPRVEKEKADVAWFVYTLNYQENQKRYKLELKESVYTKFHDALDKISVPEPGNMNEFLQLLQNKLDEKLDNPIPPDAPSLSDVLTQEND